VFVTIAAVLNLVGQIAFLGGAFCFPSKRYRPNADDYQVSKLGSASILSTFLGHCKM
jgi:hypothetical protein